MSQRQGKDMQVKILACRQVYSGLNQRGDRYTIYEVDAERAQDAHRINEKLRSFQALPIGQTVEVTVTPFESERHGRSFTLSLKGARGGNATDQVNELRQEVGMLTENLARLAQRVSELESGAAPPASRGQQRTTGYSEAELDQQFGREPPGW